MIGDSQLRWLGPEKGVMHMAIGAVVNAAWDLAAKAAGKPVWRLLADMTPEEIVASVDFRYLDDALTPAEALGILAAPGPAGTSASRSSNGPGYPAYTSTPGWIGYSDEKLAALSRQAVADGFTQIKLKVGADVADDIRRMALARKVVGPTSGSRSTPTSAGGSPRPRRRSPRSRPGTRTGSRSRQARTRYSGLPGSAARSRRPRSPSASTSRTG